MPLIKLYVDDERTEPMGWVRSSNAENAIAILGQGGVVELALDHDLDTFIDTRDGDSEEHTGYDVVTWVERMAAAGHWQLVPQVITCHSQNPAGKYRIEQAIASIEGMRTLAIEKARKPLKLRGHRKVKK